MEGHVDVYLHHSGRWIMDPVLNYVGRNVHIVEDFDVEFLSIISVKDVYKSQASYNNVKHIYVLELGMQMINEVIFLVHDDNGIKNVLGKINLNTNVVEFFANHEIDAPVFPQNILVISYDIDSLIT